MQHLPAWAKSKTSVLAAVLIALGVGIIAWPWITHRSSASSSEAPTLPPLAEASFDAEPAEPTEAPTALPLVVVYISGAVRAPDVYQLPSGARLKDLVLAAGGLSADADAEQINLAERLVDGQHVRIPRMGEQLAASPGAQDAASAAPQQEGLVNINTASAAELDGLPGIGQSFAERIVEYRQANGPFKSIEEIQNVKGIGAALFAKIAPHITVGP